jgi:tetratricopeptide (TPR) repeat protein
MLANFYGHRVSQDEIAGAIYLPEIRGTLTTDLAGYAKQFGLWVRPYTGTPADIRAKINAGIPVLVLGKFGDRHHYFLVLGFDDFAQTVTVHTDQRARYVMPAEQLWRVWDRADRWALLVCPPDRVKWKLDAGEHNDLGLFLERTGQFPAAAGNYQRACDIAPSNSYYRLNLGNALAKQKLFAEAAAAFRRAIEIEPGNADAMNNLADTYAALNANLDEAVQLCERALKLQPGRRAYYLDTLGTVFVRQGKPGDAVSAFEQALAATTDRQPALREAIRQRLAAARALREK